MNILLWILQTLLALHTAVGAVWKYSNSEQTVPSISAIPHGVWLTMGGLELLISVALILPAFYKPSAILAPIAAALIVVEMLLFCVLHLISGSTEHGQLVYWLVVAAIAAFVAYGRFAMK